MCARVPGTHASLAGSSVFQQRLSIYAHLIFHLQKGVLLNDNLKLNCINFPLIAYLILNELTGTSLSYLHVELISTANIQACHLHLTCLCRCQILTLCTQINGMVLFLC